MTPDTSQEQHSTTSTTTSIRGVPTGARTRPIGARHRAATARRSDPSGWPAGTLPAYRRLRGVA
jgi:hypothetical protein